MNRFSLLPALCLGLLAARLSAAAPEPPAPKVPRNLIQARRDAARKTYEAVWLNNREALLPLVELPYRWSCRWLQAERELSEKKADQVAALEAHRKRMRDVERITRERFRTRVVPVEEATAAEYYRLEAETWLLQEKAR